ncbi:hypothetical protein M2167_001054 [Streptomyces sp. SPB4]|nr:hypothetical protein [Streptomyces sp. SPB4]
MPYRQRMTGTDGAAIADDDILTLLVERVPETRRLVEEKYGLRQGGAPPTADTGLDLWEILLEILMWPVLQPVLARGEPDGELLRRCFGFVEDIYDESTQHRSGIPPGRSSVLEKRHPLPARTGPGGVSSMLKYYEVEGYEDGLPPL